MFHLLHTCQYNGVYPQASWLSQVSKNIKSMTYKDKQVKWRCHNDATIPKVDFNYGIVMPTLKWFILLNW